jgi:hypothetical protein
MASRKTIERSQSNCNGSTGPKTARGKERAKFNARKHGIVMRELVVSDEEKPELETLRRSLHDQLLPNTPLQRVAFERVVCCCWRCRLTTRLEMKRLNAHLKLTDDHQRQNDSFEENILHSRWYGASNADLNRAIRVLLDLRQDVASNGWIHRERWKDVLIKIFGQECFELFTTWTPMSTTSILMAEHLAAHAARFGAPLPPLGADTERPDIDPRLSWEMSVKLIDLTRQILEGLVRINRLGTDGPDWQGPAALELVTRYVSVAMRDLERAVKWYQELRAQGL